MSSFWPVTVTVWGVLQFAAVKVKLVGAAVPSPGSLELSAIVTLAVGCVFSTTVNVAVPPASLVTRPEVGVTVIPAVSLSVFVTETSAGFRPLLSPFSPVR